MQPKPLRDRRVDLGTAANRQGPCCQLYAQTRESGLRRGTARDPRKVSQARPLTGREACVALVQQPLAIAANSGRNSVNNLLVIAKSGEEGAG